MINCASPFGPLGAPPAMVPPRVVAAQQFLSWAMAQEDVRPGLTDREEGTVNAALELLRNYFNGEINLDIAYIYCQPENTDVSQLPQNPLNPEGTAGEAEV